jgi:hypothetical protein
MREMIRRLNQEIEGICVHCNNYVYLYDFPSHHTTELFCETCGMKNDNEVLTPVYRREDWEEMDNQYPEVVGEFEEVHSENWHSTGYLSPMKVEINVYLELVGV